MSLARISRTALAWSGVVVALVAPVSIAATSPLLAFREPVYIGACLAGVIGLSLLFLQPVLAGAAPPGLNKRQARRLHRHAGVVLLAVVIAHVVGLWFTSPPDVMDALLFRSPTLFSLWGVIAMWAIGGAALLALLRHRLRARTWRVGHTILAAVTVAGTVAHALLIEGTMGSVSKAVLCVLVVVATARAVNTRKAWHRLRAAG